MKNLTNDLMILKKKKKRIERLYKYVCKWSCGHCPNLD
jgi:hypothetical protein